MSMTTNEERALIDAAVAEGKVTKLPAHARPGGYESKRDEMTGRRKKVAEMTERRMSGKQIAKALDVSVATVAADRKALGISGKGRKGRTPSTPRQETKSQARQRRADGKVPLIRDRRRFKTQPVPMGQPAVQAPKDATGTIFPTRVFPVREERVLKEGFNNSKIGGDVLVGFLQGAYIYTLTLEERATCPKACQLWEGCYGNTMQHARRWRHGGSLEEKLEEELTEICTDHDRPVLIRLHILGDFYSVDYVVKWAYWLDRYPCLHVFGFTAWTDDTDIGKAVDWLRRKAGRRFMVRTSGRTGKFGSFTLPFPTEKKMIGDAVVCPEQLDAMLGSPEGKHCGNCAACWSCDNPIAFIEH